MIFVSLNYLETLEDGRQKVAGAYFGAASTLDGIAEVLKEAMRPGLTISDVRLFGQAEEPKLYARAKAWVQRKINQRRERREAKEKEWFEANFTAPEREKMAKGFKKVGDLLKGGV